MEGAIPVPHALKIQVAQRYVIINVNTFKFILKLSSLSLIALQNEVHELPRKSLSKEKPVWEKSGRTIIKGFEVSYSLEVLTFFANDFD